MEKNEIKGEISNSDKPILVDKKLELQIKLLEYICENKET